MRDWRAEIRGRLSALGLHPQQETAILEELVEHVEDRQRALLSGGPIQSPTARWRC